MSKHDDLLVLVERALSHIEEFPMCEDPDTALASLDAAKEKLNKALETIKSLEVEVKS